MADYGINEVCMFTKVTFIFCLVLWGGMLVVGEPVHTVYVGTYTGPKSKGIYAFNFDSGTGMASEARLVAECINPSFLAMHPSGNILYAVNETGRFNDKDKNGGVSAFAIDSTTNYLRIISRVPSGGTYPCHLTVDKHGKILVVANYGDGVVAYFSLNSDGSINNELHQIKHVGSGPNKVRQEGPHAHFVGFDPSQKYLFTCDLGIDRVLAYAYDEGSGLLSTNEVIVGELPAGSGPRHLAFDFSGRYIFVINELSNTISCLEWQVAVKKMNLINTVRTLPEDFVGTSTTAEILIHPSGKFLYGSNRGHNSIVVMRLNGTLLSPIQFESSGGKTPRHFTTDPGGKYLLVANQDSDNIVIFKVDHEKGTLTRLGEIRVGSPVCLLFK